MGGACCCLMVAILLGNAPPAPAHAEDPAERMPSGSLLYIGWPGAAALGEASRETAWGRLLAEPAIDQFRTYWMNEVWPDVATFMRESMESDLPEGVFDLSMDVLFAAWEYPTVLGVVSVAPGAKDAEMPLLDAGISIRVGRDDARSLLDRFKGILDQSVEDPAFRRLELKDGELIEVTPPPGPPVVCVGYVGEYFLICLGNRLKEHWTADTPAASLATDERFRFAALKVGGTAATPMFFLDLERVVTVVESFQPMAAEAGVPVLGEPGGLRRALEALGLHKLRSVAGAMAPHAGGFQSKLFLHAPDIEHNLVYFNQKPITDEDIRLVPRQPYFAAIINQDIGGLFGFALRAFETLAPEPFKVGQTYLSEFEETIGFRLREDILDSFGDTWVFCDARDYVGPWFIGMVLIGELRPGNRLQASLEKLVDGIGLVARERGRITLDHQEYRGHTIHVVRMVGLPVPLAPAWVEYEDRWILAVAPQVVEIVLDQQLDSKPSLLDNPEFQRARRELPADLSTLAYTDTAAGMRQLRGMVRQDLPGVIDEMGLENFSFDMDMLPSNRTLTRHMFGAVSGITTNGDGLLSVHYGPYPLRVKTNSVESTLAGANGGLWAGQFDVFRMGSEWLRDIAQRPAMRKRSERLWAVHRACSRYAEAHDGEFPPDLATLVKEGFLNAEQLAASLGDDEERPGLIYLPGQHLRMDSRNILLHEDPDVVTGDHIVVGLLDGSARSLPREEFEVVLEETQERLAELAADHVSPANEAADPASQPESQAAD